MTKTILKQELSLAGMQTVSLPGEYISLLCVGVQNEKIMLWFETTANLDNLGDAPKKDVSILVVGTG